MVFKLSKGKPRMELNVELIISKREDGCSRRVSKVLSGNHRA